MQEIFNKAVKSLKPINDSVIVMPYIAEKIGNIIVPESVKNDQVPTYSIVVSVGSGIKQKEDIIIGSQVIHKHTGKWLPFENTRLIVLKEDDILCITNY